jgi:hypothetical protein
MKFRTFPNFDVMKQGKYVATSDDKGLFELSEDDINFDYALLMCEVVEEPKINVPTIEPKKPFHCKNENCGKAFENIGQLMKHKKECLQCP